MHRSDPASLAVRAAGLAVCISLAVACGGGGGGGVPANAYGLVDRASVTPTARIAAVNSGSGAFAADFLRRSNFTNLIVEIDFPVGRPPAPGVLQLLEDRLTERCDKPGGVTVVLDDAIPTSEFPPVLGVADLDGIEAAHRDNYADLASQTAVMYILYVVGESDLDGATTHVVGLSYHGSSLALFADAAAGGNGVGVTTAEVEGSTLVHETGHQLGLVNAGIPMVQPHEDAGNGAHDSDPSCIMYWLINVPTIAPNLGDADFAQFDGHCVADLESAGGLGPVPARIGTARLGEPSPRVFVGTCGCCLPRFRTPDGSALPARR